MLSQEQCFIEIEKRMASGRDFTVGDLTAPLIQRSANDVDPSKVADKAVQRWRKKGWIAFTREKGVPIWSLTSDGRSNAGVPANQA